MLWKPFLESYYSGGRSWPATWAQPAGIVSLTICTSDGGLADASTPGSKRTEIFLKDSQPRPCGQNVAPGRADPDPGPDADADAGGDACCPRADAGAVALALRSSRWLPGLALPGIANLVTGSRIVLAVPGLLLRPPPSGLPWLALVVAVAGLRDLVDGTVARRFDRPDHARRRRSTRSSTACFFGAVAVGPGARRRLPALAGGGGRRALPAARRSAGWRCSCCARLPELRHTFFGQLSTALIVGAARRHLACSAFLSQDRRDVVLPAPRS